MKMFFILFISIVTLGCGSLQIASDSTIVELPGMSKSQIYQKSVQWITYRFVSGRAVIDYKNLSVGRVIAKGMVNIPLPMGSRVEVFMVATIDAVNGKSKIVVEPTECAAIAPNGARYPCTQFYTTGYEKDILAKPEEFIEDYKNYMTGGKAPAWDGK
jgi:hypothetical protein